MIDMVEFANRIIEMLRLPEEFKDDHRHWPVIRHTTGALECLVCHKMLEEGKKKGEEGWKMK